MNYLTNTFLTAGGRLIAFCSSVLHVYVLVYNVEVWCPKIVYVYVIFDSNFGALTTEIYICVIE